jgi:inorganic pyrophosphatase
VPDKSRPPLTELPCREPKNGDFRVAIETPRRSPNKYRHDPECGTVACYAHSHSDEMSLKNLKQHLVDENIEFFKEYNRQQGKEFESGGLCGPRKATKIVEAGERRFPRKMAK